MITCQSVVTSTTTWPSINDPWNLRDWSFPSIIVRGPAVTQNNSQLMHVMNEAVGRWQLAKWPRYDLILKNIVSIYPSCWVIDNIAISLRWWPFWKWRHIGSPFQFGDCGIHCSCWYRSQWQLIRFYTFLVCVDGVHWAHGPNDVISADFKDSQFEFQVSQ